MAAAIDDQVNELLDEDYEVAEKHEDKAEPEVDKMEDAVHAESDVSRRNAVKMGNEPTLHDGDGDGSGLGGEVPPGSACTGVF